MTGALCYMRFCAAIYYNPRISQLFNLLSHGWQLFGESAESDLVMV